MPCARFRASLPEEPHEPETAPPERLDQPHRELRVRCRDVGGARAPRRLPRQRALDVGRRTTHHDGELNRPPTPKEIGRELGEDLTMPAKTPSHAGEPSDGRVRLALETYLARVNRREQPAGEWREGLWFPSSGERQSCCEGIEPTAANRQALDSHCRTQGHVAVLYGVSVDDLRAVVRARRRAAKPPIARLRHRSPPEALYEMNREARNEGLEDLRAISA